MKSGNVVETRSASDRGILYLTGPIGGREVCESIVEHNLKGDVDFIQLLVNSPGGSSSDGFALIDLMEWSRIPVYTTGIGMIASMALLVFMAGAPGRRVVTPRTSILSHRFVWGRFGNHGQLVATRKEEDLEHERIVRHYLEYSSVKTRGELEAYLLREVDTWPTPEEAVKYGLADHIEALGPNRRTGR